MQECLLSIKKKPWYLDSGCSRHLTGYKECFISLRDKDGGSMNLGNNEKAKIKGIGTIWYNGSALIKDVKFVEGLKSNLLSISQLCNNVYKVTFKQNFCIVKQPLSNKLFFL